MVDSPYPYIPNWLWAIPYPRWIAILVFIIASLAIGGMAYVLSNTNSDSQPSDEYKDNVNTTSIIILVFASISGAALIGVKLLETFKPENA